MRRFFVYVALVATCSLFLPHKALSADAKGPKTATLGALNASVSAYCPGYSTADIYVGSGLVGSVTAYVAANSGTFASPSPAPTNAPIVAYTIVGNTVASGSVLSSFPGRISVPISGASYVVAAVTAYTSGSSAVAIVCSSATQAVSTPVPQPFSFDGSSNLLVNANGSSVNVANVPVPLAVPPAAGVAPTPAAPVYNFNMGQYSSSLPSVTAGNESPLQIDANGILYTHQYSAGLCADPTVAQSYASVTTTTTTPISLINGSGSKVIHICGITIAVSGAATISLGYGSGSCSAPTNFVSYPLQSGLVKTQTRELYPGQFPAGDYACVTSTGSVTVTVDATYVAQ